MERGLGRGWAAPGGIQVWLNSYQLWLFHWPGAATSEANLRAAPVGRGRAGPSRWRPALMDRGQPVPDTNP